MCSTQLLLVALFSRVVAKIPISLYHQFLNSLTKKVQVFRGKMKILVIFLEIWLLSKKSFVFVWRGGHHCQTLKQWLTKMYLFIH